MIHVLIEHWVIYVIALLHSFRLQWKLLFVSDYCENYRYLLHVEIGNTLDREISNLDFEVKSMGHVRSGQFRKFKDLQCWSFKRFCYYKPDVDFRWHRFYLILAVRYLHCYCSMLCITVMPSLVFLLSTLFVSC